MEGGKREERDIWREVERKGRREVGRQGGMDMEVGREARRQGA